MGVYNGAGKKWGRKRLQVPSFLNTEVRFSIPPHLPDDPPHPRPNADQATQRPSPQRILIHCEGCHATVQTAGMVSEPVGALNGRAEVNQSPQEDLFLLVPLAPGSICSI